MRFFKSFSLLHRRTKSDTALASQQRAADAPVLLISASSRTVADLIISATSSRDEPPRIRSSASFNHRLFELGIENRSLFQENSSLSVRLASSEAQLRLTKSELYAQMHKNVRLQREVKKNNDIISELQAAADLLRHFLEAFPDVSITFKNFGQNYHCVNPAPMSTNVQPLDSSRSFGNTTGCQSDDNQYATALQLVLKTRQELRSCKKIAMFWKRKAKLSPEHADMVTPSPSEISEVQDSLSKERKEAVAALQRRRKLTTTSRSHLHTSPFQRLPVTSPDVLPVQTAVHRERFDSDSTSEVREEEKVIFGEQDINKLHTPSLAPKASRVSSSLPVPRTAAVRLTSR